MKYLANICLIGVLGGCNVVLNLPEAVDASGGTDGESNGGAPNETGGTKNKGGTSAKGGTSSKTSSTTKVNPSATGGASLTDSTPSGGAVSSGGSASSSGGTPSTGGTSTIGGTSSLGGTSTIGGSSSIGGTTTTSGANVVASPTITSFTVDYNKVCSGTPATLTAVFSNGTGTVNGGVGTITSGIAKATGAITANTTYTLTVTNSKGEKVDSSIAVTALKSGNFTPTGAPHGSLVSYDGYVSQGTVLPNGTPVVLTNGIVDGQQVELYDLDSGEFKLKGANPRPLSFNSLAPIDNNRILIASGNETIANIPRESTRSEIFDFTTSETISAAKLSTGRQGPQAVYLPTVKKVLVVGGTTIGETHVWDTAELFDPSQGSNGAFSTIPMQVGRSWNTTTVMSDGRVLVAGGTEMSTAEIYDPTVGSVGRFTLTGKLIAGRYEHAAVSLSGGRILLAGGWGNVEPLNTAEIYDPGTGKFTATGNMKSGRYSFSMAQLGNGKVFVFGGGSTTYEIYNPFTGEFGYLLPTPNVLTGMVLPLKNGGVLLTGTNRAGAAAADIFCP
jgi:hypothetical protein